jgi:hypothetical protein
MKGHILRREGDGILEKSFVAMEALNHPVQLRSDGPINAGRCLAGRLQVVDWLS